MLFPIAIHKDSATSYGITVPDIPGCHSFGDTIDEAILNTKEAIVGHLETLIELGEPVEFRASSLEELSLNEEFKDAAWNFIEFDVPEFVKTK